METFKIKKKKGYFKESELFRKTKDLNISNNPRLNLTKFEDFNKAKYIPLCQSKSNAIIDNQDTYKFNQTFEENNQQILEKVKKNKAMFKIPNEVDELHKYEDYTKRRQSNFENPDFGQTLRNNINSIIDRINAIYDINQSSLSKNNIPEYMTYINSRITLDEFNEKGEIIRNESESDKFNFYKHKDIFCEHYNTYGGIFEKKPENATKTYLK